MNASFVATLALSLFAATASAQNVAISLETQTAQVAANTTETAGSDPAPTATAKPQTSRTCLAFTGSRVTAGRNLRAEREGRPERECVNGSGRAYGEKDIQSTGLNNIGDALRSLDTGIR
jgi:hypothetical protein